jgi:hypothetical protein
MGKAGLDSDEEGDFQSDQIEEEKTESEENGSLNSHHAENEMNQSKRHYSLGGL